jgi:hypothetical protein
MYLLGVKMYDQLLRFHDFNDRCGLDAFICATTLLTAVKTFRMLQLLNWELELALQASWRLVTLQTYYVQVFFPNCLFTVLILLDGHRTLHFASQRNCEEFGLFQLH